MPLPTTLTFTPSPFLYDRPPTPLKTVKENLRKLNIAFKPNATRPRCEYLLYRHRQGLPTHYDACEVDELQKFVRDRKIPCKPVPDEHTKLVRLLEEADEERTFEGFMSLPVELRVIVYEYHLKSIYRLVEKKPGESAFGAGVPTWRYAPAICLVSNLVAKETLPLVGGRYPLPLALEE